jgi:predicted DsbA family dithiol-disulfide isomerase
MNPLAVTLLRVPFFLEPDYPTNEEFVETNRARLHRKWGGEAAFEAQKQRHRLKERGLEVGIAHFNLDREASSTLASHRLVQWVTRTKGVNAAERLYSSLSRCHFEQGRKLNSRALLTEAAAEVGVPASDTLEFLDSRQGFEEIARAQELLRQLGVHSIPTFVVGGTRLISGAAHHDEIVAVLREVEASDSQRSDPLFAHVLGIPPVILEEALEC